MGWTHWFRTRSRHDRSDLRHGPKPDLCHLHGRVLAQRRAVSTHLAWRARAARLSGHTPCEQAPAERGRERPSGVRRQGTRRVWEGGRSRPRCVVTPDRRPRKRTRAANTAARHRHLQMLPAPMDRTALCCHRELVISRLGHTCRSAERGEHSVQPSVPLLNPSTRLRPG